MSVQGVPSAELDAMHNGWLMWVPLCGRGAAAAAAAATNCWAGLLVRLRLALARTNCPDPVLSCPVQCFESRATEGCCCHCTAGSPVVPSSYEVPPSVRLLCPSALCPPRTLVSACCYGALLLGTTVLCPGPGILDAGLDWTWPWPATLHDWTPWPAFDPFSQSASQQSSTLKVS
ncbi:hypothetical protein HDV57DRAFT_452327 [Trichoderma longibrachiatum]